MKSFHQARRPGMSHPTVSTTTKKRANVKVGNSMWGRLGGG